ncbi:MAG: hypothetical protein DI586_03335 [Micavibrio aeruginosavorus]|uniref:Uncharacterized protein n=1 Tax=Micavibrio aeruginosavorus TaxID=349221 RepID=A0A2W5FQ61_9BACT|nr:MAG: hypothetical protein DI586_03335 [Micavibrio aeruginosavorus]
MSIGHSSLTRKRVSILNRHFSYVCDPTNHFGADDLIALRQRFAINAHVLKIPDDDKWEMKILEAFKAVLPSTTASQKTELYKFAKTMFEDNKADFLASNPDDCNLSVRRISIPAQTTSLPAKSLN